MENPPSRRPFQIKDCNRNEKKRRKHLKQPEIILKTTDRDAHMISILQRSATARNNTPTRLKPKRSKPFIVYTDSPITTSCSTPTKAQRQQPQHDDRSPLGTFLETTPIHALNIDTLYTIFGYCTSVEALCTTAQVCKLWREIALDPILWRNISEEWGSYLDTLNTVIQNPTHLAWHQLCHIRTLRILNTKYSTRFIPTLLHSTQPLFKNLTQLLLTKMHFSNIIDLLQHTPNLQVLRCDQIRSRKSHHKMMFHLFSGLNQLQVLDLRFQGACEHGDYAFSMSDRRMRETLPTSLKELRIWGIYDSEEVPFLFPQHQQQNIILDNGIPQQEIIGGLTSLLRRRRQRRPETDDPLIRRYQSLVYLTNLKILNLKRCNAYTARVWRECIRPCVKNIEYLTLSGWRSKTDDMELAMQETFEGMKKIKLIELSDFECGLGIVNGIKKLDWKSLRACIHDGVGNQDGCALRPLLTVNVLLKQKVHICKIKFGN